MHFNFVCFSFLHNIMLIAILSSVHIINFVCFSFLAEHSRHRQAARLEALPGIRRAVYVTDDS